MSLERPDLSKTDPIIRAYIEALEAELSRLSQKASRLRQKAETDGEEAPIGEIAEPNEPPTTMNIITATATGLAKRTARHLYSRQRRGGMGVFGIELPSNETPALLCLADAGQSLLLLTNQGRAFRVQVSTIAETAINARGEPFLGRLALQPGERVAALLSDMAQGYLALLTHRGMVRLLRHHVFGEYMKPGTVLFDDKVLGSLAAACWTPGDGDLFIATRQGHAIRFAEKLIPPMGGPGIRLAPGDEPVGITAVYDDSGVFLLGEDGRGTLRLMSGFSANKAPGAAGKIAMATGHLIGAAAVTDKDDIFIISRLGKVIRFPAEEIPPKEGVVQGVNCMSFRADGVAAFLVSPGV
jgi:DNA gyrase subunit A